MYLLLYLRERPQLLGLESLPGRLTLRVSHHRVRTLADQVLAELEIPVRVAVVQRRVAHVIERAQRNPRLDAHLRYPLAIVLRGDDQRRVTESVSHVGVNPRAAAISRQHRRRLVHPAVPDFLEDGVLPVFSRRRHGRVGESTVRL